VLQKLFCNDDKTGLATASGNGDIEGLWMLGTSSRVADFEGSMP
jgi:hypothetical protein